MRGALAIVAVVAIANFPYHVGTPLSAEELAKSRSYYADAYQNQAPSADAPASEYETKYIRIARAAAEDHHITEQVTAFTEKYGLRDSAMLDIGSGRGYLQDVVESYTGLDISQSVGRFYHKTFVLGSATAMPFPDNSFDGGWSIWVLEHVPNPEQALIEIRRVMKNNAVLFLLPAWNCSPFAADGYEVRAYSDFGFQGKLTKASIPLRESMALAGRIPNRALRNMVAYFGPTRLHYQVLEPNYKEYWMADSDAVNALDTYETMLWFQSRGDECLNCSGFSGSILTNNGDALMIRFHKP